MPQPRKKSIDQLLDEAQLPRRAVSVCLRGDLIAEFQRLQDQLDQHNEQKAKDKRLAGSKAGAGIAEKMEKLRDQMRASSIELTVEAFPGTEWRALKGDHPMPDEPSPHDMVVRANAQTLFNDAVPKAIVEPELTDEQWAKLDKKMPDGEFQRLVDAVYDLNESAVVVPKSLSAFTTLRMNDAD